MSRFTVIDLPLTGLKLIQRKSFSDNRGLFSRLFCSDELKEAGWMKPIQQINYTHTVKKGTVRGMHFQRPPHAEMKLVSCIRGEVWDVVIDLRFGSSTFLNCHAEHLSVGNGNAILIPEGFAHGFQSLSDDVELIYFHSEVYSPESEDGLNPTDPYLRINWPKSITNISSRDAEFRFITSNYEGVKI